METKKEEIDYSIARTNNDNFFKTSPEKTLIEKIKRWRKVIGEAIDLENSKIKELESKIDCSEKYKIELKANLKLLNKLLSGNSLYY